MTRERAAPTLLPVTALPHTPSHPPYIHRYVRGEPFQQEHWAALFRKLSIEKVDLAKLTLGHFLAAGQARDPICLA